MISPFSKRTIARAFFLQVLFICIGAAAHAQLSCATNERFQTSTFARCASCTGGNVPVNGFSQNGWLGSGSGTIGYGQANVYLSDDAALQTFTYSTLTNVNPIGSGAVLYISFAANNGNAVSFPYLGDQTDLVFKYGGVEYARISTSNGNGTTGTITYSNSAVNDTTGSGTTTSFTFTSNGGAFITNNFSIRLPAGIPNSGSFTVQFIPQANGSPQTFSDDYYLYTVSLKSCLPAVSGNVFNDPNGVTDNKVNGTGTNAGGLNAILYDNTTGAVAAVAAVAANGTYSFLATPGDNFSVYISTANPALGSSTIPTVILPVNWVSTGEKNCVNTSGCSGSDSTPNGMLNLGIVNSTVSQANFAIERTPDSDPKTTTIAQPSINQVIPLNGTGANPPLASGSDPDDGTYTGSTGTINNPTGFAITSLPTHGQLFYNGVQVTKGADGINPPSPTNPFVAPNPALLSLKLTGSGYAGTSFNYAYLDAAGKQDPTPAAYTLNWAIPLPLQLLSFTGTVSDCNLVLNWETAQEINISHFDVQASTNGVLFENIGAVAATNAGKYLFSYAHLPLSGLYRLSIVEKDGTAEFSRIVNIRSACDAAQITVSPSPTTGLIHIRGLNAGTTIKIYNMLGALVTNQTSPGGQSTIDISRQPPGVYTVLTSDQTGVLSFVKIVKN